MPVTVSMMLMSSPLPVNITLPMTVADVWINNDQPLPVKVLGEVENMGSLYPLKVNTEGALVTTGAGGGDYAVRELDVLDGTANASVGEFVTLGYASVFVQVTGDWNGSVFFGAYGDPAAGGPSFALFDPTSGVPVTSVANTGYQTTKFVVGSLNNISKLAFGRHSDWVGGSAHVYVVMSKLASPYVTVMNTTDQPVPTHEVG